MEEKVPKKKIDFKAMHETYSTNEILSYCFANMVNMLIASFSLLARKILCEIVRSPKN